jgi:c-di-GMP-related signal transduction protein
MTRASLCKEMYTRICEENGPADPVLQGVVSKIAKLLADSGGDLIERSDGLQWLQITTLLRTR